jgi:hypothetical protein
MTNGVTGAVVSAYDRALSLCKSDDSRLKLSRLGAELGLAATASEWVILALYAEAHNIFGEASPITEKAFDGFAERLERVEQGIDNLQRAKEKAPVTRPPAPVISVEVTDQLDRMEARLRSIDTADDELSPLVVHGTAIAIVMAAFAVGYFIRVVNPITTLCVVALVAVLAYSYLAPLLAPSLAGALRRLRR